MEIFDIKGISKSPAIFDILKLNHINSEYIRALPEDEFKALARPYIEEAIENPGINTDEIIPLIQPRLESLTDIRSMWISDKLPDYDTSLYCHKKMKTDERISLDVLKKLVGIIEGINPWTQQNI